MKVVRSKDQTGILDDNSHEIVLRQKRLRLPPNIILAPGDSVTVDGERFDVVEYNPSMFAEIARRGAQIIQPKDAAFMIIRAGIRCGSRVLESGLGSGALSSSLLWSIGDTGMLFSVENEESAISTGRGNVERFQDTSNWEIIRGDVRKDSLPERLDSVILDIPDPWEALPNVAKFMLPGSYLVSYSPTFNQVEKTVSHMSSVGFSFLETVELIERNILVRPESTRPDHHMLGHTAFLTFAIRLSGHSIRI